MISHQLYIFWGAEFVSPKKVPTQAIAELSADLPLNLEAAEMVLIQRALGQAGGNVSKAAELLGVSRARIYRVLSQSGGDA